MPHFIGTSGYSYDAWKGPFYPADLPAREMLRYYAQQFRTVEINNTFYRMPKAETLRQWTDQVPEGFRFVIKAPQRITHQQRLKNADDNVVYLLETVDVLGDRLGPLLFQLPPNMKADPERLAGFLKLVPPRFRVALEFRHASWFEPPVFDLLRAHNAALCWADTDDGEPPLVSTADWGYLRLRREDYGTDSLKIWSDRITEQRWGDTHVFFKHEDEAAGPRFARQFLDLLKT